MNGQSGQLAKLLNYLEQHPEGITQLEAFNALGCCRLSERVREMEQRGFRLSRTPERTASNARVIRYRLVAADQAAA